MITTGQSITNSVTGETLVFRTTSADTNGEAVVVETFVAPNGAVAAAHVHPKQEETFEVLAGELEFRLGKRTLVAKAGDRVLVPAGTPHRFRNVGEETAHFVCEVKPALDFERLIETMFTLAEDGKVNKKGMPNPMRLAFIARHHFDDVRCRFPRHGSSASGSHSARRWAACSATSRPTRNRLRRLRPRSASEPLPPAGRVAPLGPSAASGRAEGFRWLRIGRSP